MAADNFRALILRQKDGETISSVEDVPTSALPKGDVLVSVTHSTLNYKDGLAVTGKGKVVKHFPMIPGIDLAGAVESSESPEFRPGDAVLATGWGLGEEHWGGYAQRARLKSAWLVPIPPGMSAEQSMAIGTAGFTAMLCVMALEERGLKPGDGPVLVTGAAGGVGSIAIAILAKLGYEVTASTGRPDQHDYLRSLGAREFVDRVTLDRVPKPMESQTWAGAVDAVGGNTLATVISQMRNGGAVAACGLAGGSKLETTVFPFILRGVALLGVESPTCPPERRRQAWERLSRDLPFDRLSSMTETIGLSEAPERAVQILAGQVRGRLVVDVNR